MAWGYCPALRHALDDGGHALSAAYAHGLQPEPSVPPLHLMEQSRHDPGAGCAYGMAQGYPRPVDVQALEVALADAPLPGAGEHLGGKGLVQLNEVHVVETEPRPLQSL